MDGRRPLAACVQPRAALARVARRRLLPALVPLAAALLAAPAQAGLPRSTQHLLARADAPLSQLHQAREIQSFRTDFRRFQQVVGGIPVLDSEVVVTDSPGHAADLVVDNTHAGIRRPGTARVTRRDAVRAALRAVGIRGPGSTVRASLAILPHARDTILVWRVLVATARPERSFEVLVAAGNGRTLRVRDLLGHATATAKIFDPNPVVQRGSTTGLFDNDDGDSAALTAARVPVTLDHLNGDGSCLTGQWVRVTVPIGTACASGGNFTAITRSDVRFEGLMAYFHITRVQVYIQSLGFGNVANFQLQVAADESAESGASFSPIQKKIVLGTGDIDGGEDADVIVHEYGHAVQDSQVPFFGSGNPEGGAMGEGFADYLAASIAENQRPGSNFNPCIAEWWQFGQGDSAPVPCLRRTDRNLTAAEVGVGTPCDAEVHCAGEAWSGALWHIRSALGGEMADRLVIESHFSLTSDSDFNDGSLALLSADQSLYAGTHQAFLRDLLVSRGLLSTENLDDSPADAAALAIPGQVAGSLDSQRDVHDVYAVTLTAGRSLVFRLHGAPNDFDLRLYRPSTVSLSDAVAMVASSQTHGAADEVFSYTAAVSGTYYLDAAALGGAGAYTITVADDADGDLVENARDNCPAVSNPSQRDSDSDGIGDACDPFPQDSANDVDEDGFGANVDNCPLVANPGQADWNANRRGDACDSASGVTLDRVVVRGRRVTLVGGLHPAEISPSSWRVQVSRRFCRAKRCAYRRVLALSGLPGARSGSVKRSIRFGRPGRYRFRAVLVDSQYPFAASPYRAVRLK